MKISYYALYAVNVVSACSVEWFGSRHFLSSLASWSIALCLAAFQTTIYFVIARIQRSGVEYDRKRVSIWSRVAWTPLYIGTALILAHILFPGIRHP